MDTTSAVVTWLWEETPKDIQQDVSRLLDARSVSIRNTEEEEDEPDFSQYEHHFVAFVPKLAGDADDNRTLFTHWIFGPHLHNHLGYYFTYKHGTIFVYLRRRFR